ncbi:NADH-quinone oxidoreductase subunit N [bacterium]|nr:NADH-quinone oxidoreductase subunit N [bacterium]
MINWLATSNCLVLFPEMILALTALVILLVAGFSKRKDNPLPEGLAISGMLLALLSIGYSPHGGGFSGQVLVDSTGHSGLAIAILGGILVLGIIPTQFGNEPFRAEASILILLSLCGVGLMVSAHHLVTLFLGLELLSLPLYILAGMRTRDPKSREAALKYFLAGAFASALMLFGMALYSGGTKGSLSMEHVSTLLTEFQHSYLFLAGWTLISIGMLFKLGAVPFHMWVLDVYQGAPSSVTAFMTFAPKIAAFLVLSRIWPFSQGGDFLTKAIWVFAIITMSAGNCMALVQRNLKRMLAYSSIAHAGYMLMAFLASPNEGRAALLFYLGVYALMNIGAFTVITLVSPVRDPDLTIISLSGLGRSQGVLAIALSICLFSLTGLPPFGGFMAKFFLLRAVVSSDQIFIAVIAVLNSLLSAYYYLRVVLIMVTRDPLPESQPASLLPGGLGSRFVLAFALIGVLLTGLLPDLFRAVLLR